MKFNHPHALGKEEAMRRVQRLASYWHDAYGVTVTWDGDSAHLKGSVKGIAFDAHLTVRDAQIEAEGTDPGLLLRAAAAGYLKKKLADYLDPKKSDDDLQKLG